MRIKPTEKWRDEQVSDMVKVLLKGNTIVIDGLIDAHIDFTARIAKRYTYRYPYKSKDIISASFHGLIQGITWAAEGRLEDENIKPYLYTTIRRFIRDFLEKDFLIPIPRKEFKKMMEEEDVHSYVQRTTPLHFRMPANRIAHIQNMPVMYSMSQDYCEDDEQGDYKIEIPTYDEQLDGMDDLFVKLELTPQEVQVINLRLEDCTLTEIGKELNCSYEWIRQIIEDIKTRLPKIGLKPYLHARKILGTKVCNGPCGKDKSLSDFYKIGEDKYKSICITCMKEKREHTNTCGH